jgi:hypothetical protein
MASTVSPSETLAWWARAAQARRVAGMLSPRDAQVAEAYAVECEDQAREASFCSLQSGRSTVQRVVELTTGSIRRVSPKEVLFLED